MCALVLLDTYLSAHTVAITMYSKPDDNTSLNLKFGSRIIINPCVCAIQCHTSGPQIKNGIEYTLFKKDFFFKLHLWQVIVNTLKTMSTFTKNIDP